MQEADRHDDADGALELARYLGGLPLALVAAGGLIRERGGSFAAYREKLAAVLAAVPAGDYPDSVIGAVKLSYDALDDDARAVLDLFAWCAPDGLEARLLTNAPKEAWVAGTREDVGREAFELFASDDRVDAALAALVRRSLLVRAGTGYSLHRMSAAAVRALQAQAGRRGAVARAAAAVLAASYPTKPSVTANWPACAGLTPHVQALHRVWPMAEGDLLASAAAEYLFNQSSLYLQEMAEPATALALAEVSLRLKQARLPESDRDVALGWSILGLAYLEAFRLAEAVAAQAEAVRLCKAHDHGAAELAAAHNNHAAALRALGQETGDRALLEQALAADEAALELERERCGEESEAVAGSLANLAWSLRALGDLAQARALSLQALAIRRKLLPSGDARLGTSLTNAGSFHLWLGEAGAALPLLTEALALRRAAYERDDHPNVKGTAGWLVCCHLVLARRDPACAVEAQRIAAEFDLDWEAHQRTAALYPGPVGAPEPPG
jgi:tetratricopeptide (TPR) repeat protein